MHINSYNTPENSQHERNVFKVKNTLFLLVGHSETQSLDCGFCLLPLQMNTELRQLCKYSKQ